AGATIGGTGGRSGTGGASSDTGGTTGGMGGRTGSGGTSSGTGGTTGGMGGRSGSGGSITGAGGTASGAGGNSGTSGGPGAGGSGVGGSAAGCLPVSATAACSSIAQGTDYPGMYVTACPPTATHVAGAVTPGGAAVTATKSGGTYTLSNGIISVVITCADGSIKTWTYKGTNVLAGGDGGGQVYWELEAGNGTCTLTSDPTTNGGNQAEVRIHTTGSTNNLDVDIDYAVLRGSSGFYATGILTHPAAYAATNGGEWRSNVYNGSIFDWNSLDASRNGGQSVGGATGWLDTTESDWVNGTAVTGAPKEVEQAPDGVYVCKYSWTADWGDTDAWGWSSSAKNIGMFIALGSKEYYNGGPKKRELMGSMLNGPDLLNMLGGSHYQGAETAETIAAGTQLSKIYGPFFYYNNSVPAGTPNANTALFADAIAQAKAEQAAWPYAWFVNPAGGDGNYLQESGRGTVTGKLTIADVGAPGASPGDMWIGLAPDDGLDPQAQFFTYQYWVKTGCDGSFSIPHVIPGTYALWSFGRGAAGTFTTATGKIPNSNILTPFTKPTASLTVTAGQTQNLGTVTITPPRTAPTVWEIGVPDRDSHEFLNGAINYTDWATSYETYAAAFGRGVAYTAGTDDYARVWNYSDMDTSPWTVSFTMAAASTGQARLYVALAANEGGSLTVTVNGAQVGTLTPQNQSDAVTRLGSHGYFWDGQIVFSASALRAGANTLTIKGSGAALEWDYLRLEANGGA
ncbi:MAG TPA: polysaccharide lyase family protein, partial [Polyangia bacterium]|nr:polysaccharide lyase family protein [Polyangia bacterium]